MEDPKCVTWDGGDGTPETQPLGMDGGGGCRIHASTWVTGNPGTVKMSLGCGGCGQGYKGIEMQHVR